MQSSVEQAKTIDNYGYHVSLNDLNYTISINDAAS